MPRRSLVRRKAGKIKRPLRWYIVWTLVYFFALSCIVTLFLSIPIWRISSVEVAGSLMVDELLIKEKATIPLGENIFFVSLKKPRENLAAIKQLGKIKISKRFPSTIIINVVERTPFAVVVIDNEAHVIDREGVILKAQGNTDYDFVTILNVSDLPVVGGIKSSQLEDYRLAQDVTAAIRVAISRSSEFLESTSLQVDMSDENNISILIEDILKVKIGSANNLTEKMDVLETILKEVRGQWNQVKYIDVRYPNSPVVRFRG
ncbi:MAG: cell division protein FtsQ/DivIB [Candidatus Margulisbacteria bacterium]|nr:cell division protein FtsQ/DivIB [Candidatus Margulisiibacteriota bacterium]MBU1021312.1 cell division protein FtsQ/DivIB [Candidatus Margulisiibacteriota bacterium]MBU1729199.1 cell division protein FtsQ/DivIB [Candidatus Margulisiibacteriota bacterium]MBU1954872.1 cell division protein FtsQ/DivIB [Candidatus Margulisiibacteriota bacterium]